MKSLIVSTLPKAGTHFVNLTLQALGFRRDLAQKSHPTAPPPPGAYNLHHYLYGEWTHDLRKEGAEFLALIRDPRAVVVSMAHHALRDPTPSMSKWLEGETDPVVAQRLLRTKALKYVRYWDEWVKSGVHFLRFEDIVGPTGGGAEAAQLSTAEQLAAWLDIESDRVLKAFNASFNTTIPLFRKGQAYGWKYEMPADLCREITDEISDLLERWGYASNSSALPPPPSGGSGLELASGKGRGSSAAMKHTDKPAAEQMALRASRKLRAENAHLIGEHVVNIGCGDGKSMDDPCYAFFAELELPGACFDAAAKPAIHENLPWERVSKHLSIPFTPATTKYLLKQAELPRRNHFLKIDIDGFDSQVLRRILELGFEFDIIQMEVNPDFPPPVHFAVRYHPMYRAGGVSGFYGASVQYVADLAAAWGYRVVEMDMAAPSHDILLVHERHSDKFDARPLSEMFNSAGPGASHFKFNLGIDCSHWRNAKDYDALLGEMWVVLSHASRLKHGDVLPFVLEIPVARKGR